MKENERAFILELEAITRKYGIAIGGCGCCGSPWIDKVDVSNPDAGYADSNGINWICPSNEWNWEHHKDEIIK